MLDELYMVAPYLDNIGISSRTQREHNDNLYKVIQRIQDYGLHVTLEKYEFS